MIDCSRNAVPKIETLKAVIRRMALSGYTYLMLYTEDTYEIKEYPFFGYLRGRYTKDDFKLLDNYARALGIELVPCIQTLGHMEQILHWEAFSTIKDTENTLIPCHHDTYKLIEAMIKTMSDALSSRRIHLGMDEAPNVGSGRYKNIYPEKSVLELTTWHLQKTVEICKKYGFQPMIWNDCYFRCGRDSFYGRYDAARAADEKFIKQIPEEAQLVHWDYWHYDENIYTDYIDLHRKYAIEPVMATGTLTSGRFWCALEHAIRSFLPFMSACVGRKIKEVLLTVWGDDGAEAALPSIMPAVHLFASLAWDTDKQYSPIYLKARIKPKPSENFIPLSQFKKKDDDNYGFLDKSSREIFLSLFDSIYKADFMSYLLASLMDIPPFVSNEKYINANCSKWLLWDDPLLGMCEPYHESFNLNDFYSELAAKLSKAGENNDIRFPRAIAYTLAIKADLRKQLVKAYKSGEIKELGEMANSEIPELIKRVRKLQNIHFELWHEYNRPFGWEVIDKRYGGLIARLETLKKRLIMFTQKKVASLPELETQLMKFRKKPSRAYLSMFFIKQYSLIDTPSTSR